MLIATMFSVLSSRRMPSLKRPAPADMPITKRFQLWLLLFVSAMLLFTFSFTYMAQTRLTLENARSLLMLNAEDIAKEIAERDSNLEQATMLLKEQARITTRAIAGDVREMGGVTAASSAAAKRLGALYEVHDMMWWTKRASSSLPPMMITLAWIWRRGASRWSSWCWWIMAARRFVSNILRYSGAQQMTVSCLAHDGQASIRFIDHGIP